MKILAFYVIEDDKSVQKRKGIIQRFCVKKTDP